MISSRTGARLLVNCERHHCLALDNRIVFTGAQQFQLTILLTQTVIHRRQIQIQMTVLYAHATSTSQKGVAIQKAEVNARRASLKFQVRPRYSGSGQI